MQKEIKCIFYGYCKGMKAYMLMYLETKKIIKCRDVVFMEISGSIKNDLEMHLSGRNEGPMVVLVDEFSKSMFVDGSGQFLDDNVQVRGNEVAIREAREGPANDNIIVEEFAKEWRYRMREQGPIEEWWKNQILPEHDVEHTNVAIFEGPLSWSKTIRHNMGKLIGTVRNSLYRVEELRNSIILKVFDYSQSESVEGGVLDCL